MKVTVKQGDVLDEIVDVLICTANPTLGMSGGVNGALLQRGGSRVQAELKQYLVDRQIRSVERGAVVRTGPGPLGVKHILHAVGVNAFYESSVDVIAALLKTALSEASALGAKSVATPAVATGYGPLSMSEFAAALALALSGSYGEIEELRVVLRDSDDAALIRRVVDKAV
jgi:O-acetyl-ADP-ribose deacetylase